MSGVVLFSNYHHFFVFLPEVSRVNPSHTFRCPPNHCYCFGLKLFCTYMDAALPHLQQREGHLESTVWPPLSYVSPGRLLRAGTPWLVLSDSEEGFELASQAYKAFTLLVFSPQGLSLRTHWFSVHVCGINGQMRNENDANRWELEWAGAAIAHHPKVKDLQTTPQVCILSHPLCSEIS